jgi:hypothetical protein
LGFVVHWLAGGKPLEQALDPAAFTMASTTARARPEEQEPAGRGSQAPNLKKETHETILGERDGLIKALKLGKRGR